MTYGSLGAVVILLMWFYLSGFMLLLGAEIDSEIDAAASKTAGSRSEGLQPESEPIARL